MIMDGDTSVGFITAWQFPEVAYIEHFAIDRAYRQHGLGALAIDRFLSLTSTPLKCSRLMSVPCAFISVIFMS